jgi:hypothetical protein
VAFVLVLQSNDEQASQALLEMFRAAREVPSAEFVVVGDGSSSDGPMLRETRNRIEQYFGVTVRYIHHDTPVGYAQACKSGKEPCCSLDVFLQGGVV